MCIKYSACIFSGCCKKKDFINAADVGELVYIVGPNVVIFFPAAVVGAVVVPVEEEVEGDEEDDLLENWLAPTSRDANHV